MLEKRLELLNTITEMRTMGWDRGKDIKAQENLVDLLINTNYGSIEEQANKTKSFYLFYESYKKSCGIYNKEDKNDEHNK